jgi:signal transduction histidine kinase
MQPGPGQSSAAIDPVTGALVLKQIPQAEKLRTAFLNKILTGATHSLTEICQTWMEMTGADTASLWLRHAIGPTDQWELSAVSGQQPPITSESVTISTTGSSLEFCFAIGRPIFVDDVQNWSRSLNGITYSVVDKSEIIHKGYRSFIAVPLQRPSPADVGAPVLQGIILAHFKIPPTQLQDEGSYRLMGAATGQAITSALEQEQRCILQQLEVLASRSTATAGNPAQSRKDYLLEVIQLIRQYLRTSKVSVFYRTTTDEDRIECLATTGLYRSNSSVVPIGAPSEIYYRKHEGITGKVFATGLPFLSRGGQLLSLDWASDNRWHETPHEESDYKQALIAYPIRSPSVGVTGASVTLGVIRCVGNESRLGPIERDFDPIQIQTLAHISARLAPTLEVMDTQIRRQRQISIIKHEIFSPLSLIEAAAFEIEESLKRSSKPPDHAISNIQTALVFVKNLVAMLTEAPAFNPRPCELAPRIADLVKSLGHYARVENRMTIVCDHASIAVAVPRQINVDVDIVTRALTNLLVNATAYGEPGTEITVSATREGDKVLLHISNYGIGVKDNERNLLFEADYRSPRARAMKVGSGLGLKVARAGLRRHGGDLLLTRDSDPTTFTMVIPAHLKAE